MRNERSISSRQSRQNVIISADGFGTLANGRDGEAYSSAGNGPEREAAEALRAANLNASVFRSHERLS